MHNHKDLSAIDPIVTEIIRNAFTSAAHDMKASLVRSAYSPVIYESHDCAVGLFNEKAEILGQAPGLPFFIGALDGTLKLVTEMIGPEKYQEGDIYIVNDSYITGSHLNDVTIFAPVFYQGRLVGFTATKAHWVDVGAANPGMSIGATEIYQEGLRLGPVKLMDRGEMVSDIVDILARNSRFPHSLLGDMNAQIAACRMGKRRYLEMIDRFGLETVRHCMKVVFDRTEALERQVIEQIPDGVYEAEAYGDGDLMDDSPFPVKVKITVAGSDMTIDTRGSSGLRQGCGNTGLIQSISGLRLAYKFLIRPDIGVTGGSFRPLKTIFDVPSAFAAQEPAACFAYGGALAIDLTIKALAPAMNSNVTAGGPGSSWNVSIVSRQPQTASLFVSGEALAGGWGAGDSFDGESAIIHMDAGDFKNTPIETAESKYPFRIRHYGLGLDSGGAGQFRGGLNVIKEYETLAETNWLGLMFDRTITPSWGLFGGRAGSVPKVILNPGSDDERSVTKVHQLPAPRGLIFRAYTGGGGGYGPPWARDLERVRDDVIDGYVSKEQAGQMYGVIFKSDSFEIDFEETRQKRQNLTAGST